MIRQLVGVVKLICGVVLSSFGVEYFSVANNLTQPSLMNATIYFFKNKFYLQEACFSVVDTGFQPEERTNFNRLVESYVADVTQLGSELAVQIARRPGDFKGLSHQETAKDFIVQITVLN